MGAADLLVQVRSAGITLDVADGQLRVRPASKLTDALRDALRACKPELIELIERRALDAPMTRNNPTKSTTPTTADLSAATQNCTGCQHYGRRHTCLEPVRAGLLTEAEGFGIVWPEPGRADTCPAWAARSTS